MEDRMVLAIEMREKMGIPTRVPASTDAEGRVTTVQYDLGFTDGLVVDMEAFSRPIIQVLGPLTVVDEEEEESHQSIVVIGADMFHRTT